MELVRSISDKNLAGASLTADEEKIWIQASSAISVLAATPICHLFTASSPAEPAVCCTVHVLAQQHLFAFCTLEKFLPISVSALSSTTRMASKTVMAEAMKLYMSSSTVYINLLDVPCTPAKDDGLCSQYVCCVSPFSLLASRALFLSDIQYSLRFSASAALVKTTGATFATPS